MTRLARRLTIACLVCGASLSSLTIAEARKPAAVQRAELREAASRELSLTETANAVAKGQAALERERESLDWAAELLTRRGREGLRKLDTYRERRVERSELGEERARELYKLARGGGMLELMFEDGADGRVTPHERSRRANTVRRLVDRDLQLLRVHADAEAKARDELLTATRELRVVAALESVARLQADALALTDAALDPALRDAHQRRLAVQQQLQGRKQSAELSLLTTLNQERRELLRARGLDLLEPSSLVRPVRGRTVGKFGTYDDPLLDVPMHRNGVELAAAANDPVKVIAPGRVVLVGALPGFERVVVVDHGGGYLSLTARLLTINVSEGDELEAGALLGRVGPKAVPDGLGTTVYVEIRHGQRPIDPHPYLR